VALRIGEERGQASFDLDYTPAPPAVFTGAVREALADGSLDLFVGMRVERGGRYIVRARVEDASGRRFAYLSESVVLSVRAHEIRFQVFGKVAVDAGAQAPFRLRDLEGFRLAEDTFPDREALPSLDGVVYTTRTYASGDLSPASWESEARSRRVELLARDVEEARRRAGSG
jgi:hypothetical protein